MIFLLAGKLLKMLSKIAQKRGYSFVAEMSDEDIVRNIDYLAHSLRKTRKRGAGVTLFPIKMALSGCRRCVLKKEKRGLRLFGFEKWIKENYRLLFGALSQVSERDFARLPHVNGVPRIVILADFIVKYTGGKIKYETIQRVLSVFRSVTPLGYDEIEALQDALSYRLLFEISLFAERSISYHAEYLRAEKRKFSPKHALSDSYLTFYSDLHKEEGRVDQLSGRDEKAALLGFENLLADNETLTSSYINSLRDLPTCFDITHTVALSGVNEIYLKEETYRNMSDAARRDYLQKTHALSLRFDVEEGIVARAALLLGERHKMHFGEVLFHYPKALRRYLRFGYVESLADEKKGSQGGYVAAVLLIALGIAAFPAYYLHNVIGYLTVLPLFIALLHPVEYLVKRFVGLKGKQKPVHQMDYKVIPDRYSTIVVTSRFIADKKDAEEALLQAHTLASSEKDPAIRFVVLADYPSTKNEWDEKDDELTDYISTLPRSEKVCILVRKRVKQGGKYVAHERKRGAILDLFQAIKTGEHDAFHCVGEFPHGEFAVLLDDDSEVLPGTIKAAVQAMAHPLNQKYDLMSFGGRLNRYSIRTHYGLRFLRSCGVDAYPHYSDFYANTFDRALYCGKAIVRIGAYLDKLQDFFPDGRILSHDIIEGAVLSSGCLKRCVYEDVPATFCGDAQRSARWQRGDVQLLPYALCTRIKDRKGKRIKNPIDPIYRLVIFINGMSVLRELMILSLLVLAFVVNSRFLLYYVITAFLFTKAYAFILAVRTFFTRVRFCHAFRAAVYSVELLAEEMLLLPFRALLGAFLFSVTCVKMIAHSASLLEWKPFRTTQGAGGMEQGAKMLLPSVILVSAFCILAGNLYVTIYAGLVFLYDFYLLLSGKALTQKAIKQKDQDALKEMGKSIYAYFEEHSGEGLIPDNLQLFPYEIEAKMTSPTNLGFSLLAEVCALKLDFIVKEKAISRIETLVESLEKLEKWNGHLFNWYDTKTYRVMPPRVVSAVDSANLVACMIVVKNCLSEMGEKNIANRLDILISNTDFTALYDPFRKFLVIAHYPDENRSEGSYDLLASEAKLAYLLAISQGVDAECYFRLGRECSSVMGNTLLSWSGTAFEYMLPRLFVKAPIGSLWAEQEYRSGKVQIKDKTQGVFGRSECGYADLNNATAYCYKAVGCSALALSDERADVIAPYACFLYLPEFPSACLENCAALRKKGMQGKYGFYEAIDFEKGGVCVRSFMTHHQGMALAAITNALCSDAIVRLFCSSPEIRCVRLLLTEENIITKQPKRYPQRPNVSLHKTDVCAEPERIPKALAISCGEYKAMYDALGRSYAKLGDIFLTEYHDYLPEKGGIFFSVREGDNKISPCFYPHQDPGVYAQFDSTSVRYVHVKSGISCEVYPLKGYDGELRVLNVPNETDEEKTVEVCVYADVMLNTQDAYDSHPAYSDMFVSAEDEGARNTAYLYRKNAECKITAAVSFSLMGLNDAERKCNAYAVSEKKEFFTENSAARYSPEDAPCFGEVLYPCFYSKGTLKVAPHECGKVYLCIFGGSDPSVLKERVEKIDLAYRSGAIELLGRRDNFEEGGDLGVYLKLCGELLFARLDDHTLAARFSHREELQKYGIDVADKLLILDLEKQQGTAEVKRAAQLSHRLLTAGIKHKLVILSDRITGAGMDSLQALNKLVSERGAQAIILARKEGEWIRKCASVDLATLFTIPSEKPLKSVELLPEESLKLGEIIYPTGEGGLTKQGYSVRPRKQDTLLPYANVIGGEKGGFVITERGGGFTFGENAREDKLSVWSGDALRDLRSECIILTIDGEEYILNGNHCEHRVGSTVFSHKIGSVGVSVICSLADSGATKVYEVILSDDLANAKLSFCVLPALGWRFSDGVFASQKKGGFALVASDSGRQGYVSCLEGGLQYLPPREKAEMMRFESVFPLKRGAYHILFSSRETGCSCLRELTVSRAKTLCEVSKNRINVSTGVLPLDALYNRILPYQTLSARLNVKTGFYQCSGAVGFRDQLQDSLSLLISDPERVKRQILDAARHQYREGDVQHWWHPPRVGVRTRISDDRLWLAFVTARYVEVTGDHSLLDQSVPFLSSTPLGEKELSRYEIPQEGESATLREHILRAIKVSLKFGDHGLLKMGSGDWNDGLDRLGVKGKGESVWLTMFAYKVIEDVMSFFGDDIRRWLGEEKAKLQKGLAPLLKDGRYPLAFTDEGKPLGYLDTPDCTIALNPQTWAVLSGAVPEGDAQRALESVRELVDPTIGIIKLSAPPFDCQANYGYISAYPKGVRENGGQYTHAAVWYLKALLESGNKEEGYRVLKMLNPLLRCASEEDSKRYKGEPYVLAGDIYGYGLYRGRAGWTWYTGSAGWLKYVLTEDFFGIKKRGDTLFVKPNFPSCFDKVQAVITLPEHRITVKYERGKQDMLFLNGEKISQLRLSECEKEAELVCHFC
ncbi:MAG TPA: hypothetical protein DIC18_01930 [Clostridiales bacterium]|nr:hypothetical protein [Clostridiales bacterium]